MYVDLLYPFSLKSKTGKEYEFFYVSIASKIYFLIFPFITSKLNLIKNGYRMFCGFSDMEQNCIIESITDLKEGITKAQVISKKSPYSIIFYGGYIK